MFRSLGTYKAAMDLIESEIRQHETHTGNGDGHLKLSASEEEDVCLSFDELGLLARFFLNHFRICAQL